MKKLLLISGLLLSMNSFANTVEIAEGLYEIRGENVKNAVAAAKVYGELAHAALEKSEKAKLFYRQSEATYYVGNKATDNGVKEKIHKTGYEYSQKVISLLEGNVDDFEEEETLALAYFFYGANLGKWAEARGVSSSLGRAGELKETMQKIIDLGQEEIENYGAHRVLGRAFFKLPFFAGGSDKKAEKFLKEAFENTLSDDGEVSVHGLNNLYYAEVLEKRNKKARACEILNSFSKQSFETLLETRIPETKEEIEAAKKMIADFDC